MTAERNDPVSERDFYRRLLDLVTAAEPEPLLDQALELIVEATGARVAYLELRNLEEDQPSPAFWKAHGLRSAEALASIRATISRGIIARALAERRMVETPSAVGDPEFRAHPSVLRHDIQAVLCAPFGAPPAGVVYLQGSEASTDFVTRNREPVGQFARLMTVLAERLMARHASPVALDATAEIRRRFHCDGILGRSAALARVLREAAQVAPLAITVLLTGPGGTGKSALARAIAANSPRATGPYVDLNCAALPENLFEGELFGTELGAFTGATRRPGKIAMARGGTLFLDEVAELSLGAQAKLLQVLQERHYYPLGATAPVTADVRVLSATNADLRARVAERRFREDLYYRLAVLPIALPGLDERREDIPLLVERFCADACRRNGLASLRVTRRALVTCREASWPGNVRELGNAIEAAVARASFDHSDVLEEHHVFPSAPRDRSGAALTYREASRRFQRRYVQEALDRHDWNVTRAAVDLDLSRQHLHDLITSFDLRRPESKDQGSDDP